jgi:PhzF family phenazine biosynthesis protein
MAHIAAENNLSETAFFVPRATRGPDGADITDPVYDLRWFTPSTEVDLCGHATLASGWLVLNQLSPDSNAVHFHTRSGWLSVRRGRDGRLAMDLPSHPAERGETPAGAADAIGAPVVATWVRDNNMMLVVDHESTVRHFQPDFTAIRRWASHLVILTAPAEVDERGLDFVSRVFAAGAGVDEDPVTGSAHTMLGPYWRARLNRAEMRARQISARGGDLWVFDRGDRTVLEGHAVLVIAGLFSVAD